MMIIGSKFVFAVFGTLLLLCSTLIDAQCVGVYDATQLRDAIKNANFYNNSVPTLITLCSDFKLGNVSASTTDFFQRNVVFDFTDRNIQLRCNKTITGTAQRTSRCVFDAESKDSIFYGDRVKLSVLKVDFINSLNSAWLFYFKSIIIVQQCSFLNNKGVNGGAISMVFGGRLIIRGGTYDSPNLFYNNTAKEQGGAIYTDGREFITKGQHTNFISNLADLSGGAIEIATAFSTSVKITGVTFSNNKVNRFQVSSKRIGSALLSMG
jgi:predicted outer membrane repeat protein